jgi:pimeloyl-ACP methyl ester carboxylesterase
MPTLQLADAEIYYEEFGSGFPVLAFAPGGHRSQIGFWQHSPRDPAAPPPWLDPTADLAKNFRVIAMDQRNAGKSRGRISAADDWRTFARDHLALMDHLKIERCHTLGGCIGATFCLTLCAMAPARVVSAVLLNPIGLSGDNGPHYFEEFETWATKLKETRPELDDKALHSFAKNLYSSDFVFSVTRDFVAKCEIPMLVLPGTDLPHPTAIGLELAQLAPRGEMVKRWRGPEHRGYSAQCAQDFLLRNTPVR